MDATIDYDPPPDQPLLEFKLEAVSPACATVPVTSGAARRTTTNANINVSNTM
jgi:hypothetical protein